MSNPKLRGNKRKKRKISRAIQRLLANRFLHKMRRKIRAKMLRGAAIARVQLKKYKITGIRRLKEIGKYRNQTLREYEIHIPEVLSFIDAPKETMEFLTELKRKLNKKEPFELSIIHEKCRQIDLAASYIFDMIIKDELAYWKSRRVGTKINGRISLVSKKVNNFLLSFGLLSDFGRFNASFTEKDIDFDYRDKYETYKYNGCSQRVYDKSQASTGLVQYFNKCFNHNNLQILDEARYELGNRFGEIIGNAEEHSGEKKGTWVALGCYDKDDRECSFAIVNFGRSIYESLSNEYSTAAGVIENIADVISSNRKIWEKTIGFIEQHQEEPLWNVMALQDGISSKRTISGKGSTRGKGIMDVLTFIGAVKSEEGALVRIISGHSAVMMDYTYPIIEREIGANKEKRRILYFNKEKDLKRPPDKDKVFAIKKKFEGTVFAGRFKINEKYLVKKLEIKK